MANSQRRRGVLGGSSWVVARVAGIEVALDVSWLLIFALITWSLGAQLAGAHPDWGPVALWGGAAATSVVFFVSIVLHELGHSLTAVRLGLRVRSITLFLFGGVAELDSEPRRPRDELLIAVAGPAVSAVLGVGFLLVAVALPPAPRPVAVARAACEWLGSINLLLVAFNALPGFPLDGGRVLRGVLWGWTGSFERATRAAVASGSVLAYTLMGAGALLAIAGGQLIGGLWLVLIGWFLLTAARATAGAASLESVLSRVRVGVAMDPAPAQCLAGTETVDDVARDLVLRYGERTLYVADASGGLRGLVTLRELSGVAPERRATTPIRAVMVPASELATLAPHDTGWDALRRMTARGVNQLPVIEDGRLVGVVTRERLLALLRAGLALREAA